MFTMNTKLPPGSSPAFLYFSIRNQWIKVGRHVIGGKDIDRELLLEKSVSSRLDSNEEDITESTVDTESDSDDDEDPFEDKEDIKEEIKNPVQEPVKKEEVKKPAEIEAYEARVARRRQDSTQVACYTFPDLFLLKAITGILIVFLAIEILFS